MAWPTSPLTSYIANSSPVIKAADLNSIQSAINNAFLGTYSFKGIVVDGVGGAAATPTAGRITATENIVANGNVSAGTYLQSQTANHGTNTAGPCPTPAAIGALYADLVPVGWLYMGSGATTTITAGANISSVSHSAAGTYTVNLVTAAASLALPVATALQNGSTTAYASAWVSSGSSFNVRTFAAGALADTGFVCLIMGY